MQIEEVQDEVIVDTSPSVNKDKDNEGMSPHQDEKQLTAGPGLAAAIERNAIEKREVALK